MSSDQTFYVEKTHPDAKLPVKANPGDAGFDLTCVESTTIPAWRRTLVRIGLKFFVPHGYYGRIAPRSGLAWKRSIDIGAGVVDSGYRDEVRVLMVNQSDVECKVEAGTRIAQLILEKYAADATVEFLPSDELPEDHPMLTTSRGHGGFGSTGI